MRKKNLPVYAYYVMSNHPSLFAGALRECGSWNKALQAAGIKPAKNANGGRLGILRALRDALEGHSRDDISQALRLNAALLFRQLTKSHRCIKKRAKLE